MGDMPPFEDATVPPGREPTNTPRWVKVFGIIAIVLIALFLALMIFGGGRHGPGRHTQAGDAGADTPPADARR